MIEYIEGAKSLLSLAPTVKKMFSKKNRTTIEMWGNWEAFENAGKEYRNDIGILQFTCGTTNNKYDYESYKKKGIRFFLVGEIGYWKLFKRYWKCYKYYLINRTDLSIIGRIRLAHAKSKRWITKWKFRCEIDKYFKRKESFDREFKRKFNDKEIDIIYLYLFKKELK